MSQTGVPIMLYLAVMIFHEQVGNEMFSYFQIG